MRRLLVCFFVFFVLFSGPAIAAQDDTNETTQVDYIIHASDIVEISIYGEPELIRSLIVRPDGKVSFPLIGDIEVAGHTTMEVKGEVDSKLRTYIPEANSTVIISSFGSLKYFVIGEVARPGMFNEPTPLNVLQALSLAGGLKTFADEDDILIIRGYGDKTEKIRFDYSEVKTGKHLGQNILLERGDVVLVP